MPSNTSTSRAARINSRASWFATVFTIVCLAIGAGLDMLIHAVFH